MSNFKELNKDLSLDSEMIHMLDKQLKILIKKNSTTVIKLSKDTGINTKTIYNYLDGRSPRDLKHVRKLCEYFKVSADFLLFGLGDQDSAQNKSEPAELNELIKFGKFDVYLKRI